MADREMIAATLAAGVLAPEVLRFNVEDMDAERRRIARHAVDVYQAIVAELARRKA